VSLPIGDLLLAVVRQISANSLTNMEKTEFRSRVMSTWHSRKYFFDDDFDEEKSIQRVSTGYKILATSSALVAGGLISALGTKSASFSDEEVRTEMSKLKKLVDLAGIRLDTGAVSLALFVYADNLSDDQMIGRSVMIRDQMKSFKNFSMRLMLSKMGVYASVFHIFEDSSKAFHFRQSVQAGCKHMEMFKKSYVLPWGIDLSAKSVWAYKGLPLLSIKPEEIEAKLFCN
jgi:hypothetical protein